MFSILPFRRPITTVVGAPIIVEKQSRPSQLEVDALHQRYCDALIELFEKHKSDYGLPADAHLNIL
jgi:2-acylglycerol O-acyltransferase 2